MPDVMCTHPGCGKTFRCASWMRKHKQTHELGARLPCPLCPKLLKSKDTLRQHIKTEHNNQHRYRCPVCRKGFQNYRKLTAHHRTHGSDTPAAQKAASGVLGSAAARLIERLVAPPPRDGISAVAGHSVTCASCKAKAPRDNPALFECAGCSKMYHWVCSGLPAAPEHPLPLPQCTACLAGRNLPASALSLAAIGRDMAAAYVAKLGRRFEPVAADGWCLLRSVAKAVGVEDPKYLLRGALAAIVDNINLVDLETDEAGEVRAAATRVLDSRSGAASRRIDTLSKSGLWDYMPRALSFATARPLHIYSGNAKAGTVTLTVVDETDGTGQDAPNEPVTLIQSGYEYGCSHYDLATTTDI